MSNSTACMSAILSWVPRTVKIVTILVTGATGNIGRRIVDHLIDLGANDIHALTKSPAKARLPDGVTAVTGYLGDPESLPAAFEGVERMYLAPLPETLDTTLELVKQARVEYVVALSGEAHWQAHIRCRRLRATRTVRGALPDGRGGADLHGRHRQGGGSAAGQAHESHFGRMYPITGRETLSRARIAEQIDVGIGVPISYQQCDRAEAEAAFQTALGRNAAWYLDQIEDAVGHPQEANELVTGLTGAPAQSVVRGPRRTPNCSADYVLKYFASGWCSTNASVDCSG